MERILGAQTLACVACGSEQFVPVYHLSVRPQGGMVTSPRGYECAQCRAPVDVAQMQRQLLIQARRRELDQLQAEVGVLESTV